jgi:ABC-2 type transport system permease protein
MRLLRLFLAILAVSTTRELAHRVNLFFQILVTAIGLGAGLATLAIVFSHAKTLAGWRFEEVVAVLGAFQVVSGLISAFVEPNLSWFGGKVRDGQMDEVLLQPVPSLLLASLGSCNPWSLFDVLLGAGILGWSALQMGASITIGGVFACLVLLLAGVVIAWAYRVLLASVAFWAPGADPTLLYSAFWQLGRYPVGIYPRALRLLLTSIVPVAFIATFPALMLSRGGDLRLVPGGVLAALGAVLVVQFVWLAALRRYTSATS